MENKFMIYNTLTRKKEEFVPLHAPNVGLYVCGPTVYGDAHLGHARPAITFDVLFRYLTNIGYKVRYVRNITDVGHLEHDADEGEDVAERPAGGHRDELPDQRGDEARGLGDAGADHGGDHQADRGEAHEIGDEGLVHEPDAVRVEEAADAGRGDLDLVGGRRLG
jgi:hypothetical protein